MVFQYDNMSLVGDLFKMTLRPPMGGGGGVISGLYSGGNRWQCTSWGGGG